jgi:Type I phosphodiesterase / nucleotide pyrophosphatase
MIKNLIFAFFILVILFCVKPFWIDFENNLLCLFNKSNIFFLNESQIDHTSVHIASLSDANLPFYETKNSKTQKIFNGKTEHLILVTLDGFRWQELFGGVDSMLLNELRGLVDFEETRSKFWARTPTARREKLMPFFWKKMASNGLVFGNRWHDSRCEVTNSHRISVPGYAEMLCGMTDARLFSNLKIQNPNPTVFEFLNNQQPFRGRVAVFGSWNLFPYIYNDARSKIYVNTTSENAPKSADLIEQQLIELEKSHPSRWPGIREDLFTFKLGMEYLKREKPRLCAFHFDGTDDSAHDGQYENYLNYAYEADSYLEILWNFVQKDPFYKGKTTILVTTDHGRGGAENAEWRNHGAKIAGSEQTWVAIFSPDLAPIGEITVEHPTILQKQIGPTIAALLGYNFEPKSDDAGTLIEAIFSPKYALIR